MPPITEVFGLTDMKPDANPRKITACFIFFFILDVLDVFCDWLFFYDVYIVEKGLVFGPHEPALVWAILAFAIVGTVDFPLQLYVTVSETLCRDPSTNKERRLGIFNLIILIIEDLPQAVLLLIVSLCREDPSSIWGLIKASFILVTGLIKFVPNIIACFRKCSLLKTLVLIGAFLELAMAVAVFIVTQVEIKEKGGLHFNEPTTVLDERFNEDSYLAGVSVYLHDPSFLTNNASMTSVESSELKWVRLGSLRQIRKNGYESVRLEYEKSARYHDVTKLRVWEKDASDEWFPKGCYTISTDTGRVETLAPTSLSCSFSTSESSNLFLSFQYIKPDFIFKKHIMGNIIFNAKYQRPGRKPKQIRSLNQSAFSSKVYIPDNNYTELEFDGARIKFPILLHFFRYQPVDVNITMGSDENINVLTIQEEDKNTSRLFSNKKKEMIDVKEIWKTGWLSCPTTGNLGPEFDADLRVDT